MLGSGYSKYQKIISTFGDTLILVVSFVTGYYLRFGNYFNFSKYDFNNLFLIYIFTWWLIINSSKFDIKQRGIQIDKVLMQTLRIIALHGFIIFAVFVVFRFYHISRLMMLYAYFIQAVLLILWRILYLKLLNKYRIAGYNFRNIVILGTNKNAIDLYHTLTGNKSLGYNFISFFSGDGERENIGECRVLPLSDFERFADKTKIDEVFTTLTYGYEERIREIIRYCDNNLIRFKLVPNFQRYIPRQVTMSSIGNIPLILLREEPLESVMSRLFKRIFDIAFSLIVTIIFLSWIIPIIAIIIRVESKGPVFFVQKRTGKNNMEFPMIKFRSMAVNKYSDKIQAKKNDMRITKVGKFIRKTSIDELPQFLNVLAGHMSIVGPRPHMLKHTYEYSEIINRYMVRHFVKPGITGWAQINGYRGETNTPDLMEKRVQYDVWYIENWSFVLDLVIIFRTIVSLIKGDDKAY